MVGIYRWFADQHPVQPQKRDDQRGEVVGKRLARCDFAIPGIEMGEHHTAGKPRANGWQSFAHIAKQEESGWRNTIGMGCHDALADIDFAMREELSKMIVRPAVAEPELQHLTIQTGNQVGGRFEASALRLEASNEAVQSAHRYYAATSERVRSRSISARAVRS